MTQFRDAGGKVPALSRVDSLLIVRRQTGRKLSIQIHLLVSLFTRMGET